MPKQPIDLNALVAGMVSDVKKGKFKSTKKKVVAADGTTKVVNAVNPWTDEALVLIMYNTRCTSCGNEATSWEESLYVERHNTRRRLPITQIEKLGACAYSSVYGGLTKRIEVIQKTSCTCPQCFGIGDSNHGKLFDEVLPNQLALFKTERNHENETTA